MSRGGDPSFIDRSSRLILGRMSAFQCSGWVHGWKKQLLDDTEVMDENSGSSS